jgi:hypothetical protein
MRRTVLSGLLLPITAALLTSGCESSKPSAPDPAPTADLETFFRDLPAWETFAPILPDADEPVAEPDTSEEVVGEETYDCTTTPYSLTRTPEKIVTLNPDAEILWPGVLLQGDGHLQGIGSLAELPIRQRAPLTLSIDLLTEANNRTVTAPDLASVNSAVGELIQAAHDAGHVAGSNIFFTQETMHSVAQASLKMGISASYMGAEVESSLEGSISAEKSRITAYFVQRMFTVSMVLPQSPEAVFSDAFTQAELDRQVELGRIGPDNLPVFVSSVAYGRILMFSFISDATEAEIRQTLNVVYNGGEFGGGGELSSDQRAILENAEINIVTVGGDADNALALIRSGDLRDYFAEDAALTSAVPISFTVRNLADNSIAKVSETTNYNLTECVPQDLEPTGAEYEITLNQIQMLERGPILACSGCIATPKYALYVEDVQGSTIAARKDNVSVFDLFCVDEIHDLQARRTIRVSLHFDGRDQVRIYGNLELVDPGANWSYDIRFRNSIPTGNRAASRWSNFDCQRIALRYNVRKVGDLFD